MTIRAGRPTCRPTDCRIERQRSRGRQARATQAGDCEATSLPQGTPPPLEPEVLKRLSGAAVENRCAMFVSELASQIPLGDPRSGAVRCGRQLGECVLGVGEGDLRLFEPFLLEQRPTENEPRGADLVDP